MARAGNKCAAGVSATLMLANLEHVYAALRFKPSSELKNASSARE